MGRNTFYRCGNNGGNPFKNNSNGGITDIRIMYGLGFPSDDMAMSKGRVMYGKIKKNGCALSIIPKGHMGGAKFLDMLHPHIAIDQD